MPSKAQKKKRFHRKWDQFDSALFDCSDEDKTYKVKMVESDAFSTIQKWEITFLIVRVVKCPFNYDVVFL